MTHNGTLAAWVVALVGVFSLHAMPAAACEELGCGRFVPGAYVTIPSNTPALAALHFGALLGGLKLTRIDGNRNEQVPTRLEVLDVPNAWGDKITLIRPVELVEGGSYRLEQGPTSAVGCQIQSESFSVGPKAELPTVLGTLRATESFCERIESPCVSSFWGARSWLMLSLDHTTTPWLQMLLYRRVVNQSPWGYRSDIAYGSQGEVQLHCSDQGAPESAPFDAYLEAMLPGSADTLKTDTISFELRCEKRPVDPPQSRGDELAAGSGAVMSPASMEQPSPAANGCSVVSGATAHAGVWLSTFLLSLLILWLRRGPRRWGHASERAPH